VRVGAHRPVDELDRAAEALELVEQDHLVDVVAGQAIGLGAQDAVELAQPHRIPQPIQAGPVQARPALPIIAERAGLGQMPAPVGDGGPQALQLLVDGLRVGLLLGRHPGIDGHSERHRSPPARSGRRLRGSRAAPRLTSPSIAGGVGRPGPSAAGRPGTGSPAVESAIGASSLPPRWDDSSRR
jgi:hypothetical protein